MNKLTVLAACLAGGAIIAVPTALALGGTPSFHESIPVRTPAHAATVSFDKHGHAVVHPGQDDRRHRSPVVISSASPTVTSSAEPAASPTPRASLVEAGDDSPGSVGTSRGHLEPGDDHRGTHGGSTGSTAHAEPGDDHGGTHGGSSEATGSTSSTSSTRHDEPADKHGHGGHSSSPAPTGSSDDHSGSGNSGPGRSDDSGGGHHGGDD